MDAYVLRRILQLVPVVFAVLTLNFVLVHLTPGDPVYVLAGDSGSAEFYAAMRAKFGLDRPLPEQYAFYVANAVRGEFGYSYAYGQPVLAVILEHIPATLLLMGAAQIWSALAGIGLGIQAAGSGNNRIGAGIRIAAALAYALPVFWIGQFLILLLAYVLGWFPVYGMESLRGGFTGLSRALDVLHHLFLPALALGLVETGLIVRITDAAMREQRDEEYVRVAHAKGLDRQAIEWRHILRNALLPVVTVIGNQIGSLLTGAVLVEIVFAWPGLGRLLYDATLSRDYPLLMAIFFLSAVGVVAANLGTDLVYARLDPRVRYR